VFRPYLRVLRARGAARPVTASMAGALSISMSMVGVLLHVRISSGSFAYAGIVGGSFTAGNAVGLVVQGQLIDRLGQSRVLLPAGVSCFGFLVSLAIAVERDGPLGLLVPLALAAGVCVPAVISCMRVLWSELVTDAADRVAAYALAGMQVQIATIVGPLIVSGLLLVSGPMGAVIVAAGLAGTAGVLFATSPVARRWRPSPSGKGSAGLGTAGMWTLLVGGFGGGVSGGMMTVGVPAAAVDAGATALTGVLFAAMSVGDLVGGLVYGARRWRVSHAQSLFLVRAAAAAAAGLAAVFAGVPIALVVVLAVVGLLLTPAGIAASTLLDDVVPRGALTRAFTSLIGAGLVGMAAGSALAGQLAGAFGTWATFAGAALLLSLVAGWIGFRLPTLAPR
jgi:MFS family permease